MDTVLGRLCLVLALLAGCDVVFRLDELHDGGGGGGDINPVDDSITPDGPVDPRVLARFDFEGTMNEQKTGLPAECLGGSGCPGFKAGKHGMAIELDGNDDCLKFVLPSNPTQLTVTAWINKFTDTGQSVVSKPYAATNSDTFQIDIEANQNVRFITWNGTMDRILTQTNGIALNAWAHVAVTFDNNTYKRIYIDGGLVQTAIGETMVSDGSALLIGCDHETSTYARYFAGRLDEIIVYNAALGATEIASLATP